MQQRLAIARAFAYPAEILLMDEPYKSLDLEIKGLIHQRGIKLTLKVRLDAHKCRSNSEELDLHFAYRL